MDRNRAREEGDEREYAPPKTEHSWKCQFCSRDHLTKSVATNVSDGGHRAKHDATYTNEKLPKIKRLISCDVDIVSTHKYIQGKKHLH
eukprot:m.270649 g.270649  ORF g.270649 m.270649 type:complete len:88 (+) comp16085_c0_seq6:387-650(+)